MRASCGHACGLLSYTVLLVRGHAVLTFPPRYGALCCVLQPVLCPSSCWILVCLTVFSGHAYAFPPGELQVRQTGDWHLLGALEVAPCQVWTDTHLCSFPPGTTGTSDCCVQVHCRLGGWGQGSKHQCDTAQVSLRLQVASFLIQHSRGCSQPLVVSGSLTTLVQFICDVSEEALCKEAFL